MSADADPASDVLLGQSAFYPYQPAVSHGLEAVLNHLLSSAEREGLPLKVAVIGSREDLGAIPSFFGHPQAYARFLDQEISYNNHPPLLVVMPAGFGVASIRPVAELTRDKIDTRHATNGLVRSAIDAVVTLMRWTGHAVKAPSIPSTNSSGSGPPMLLIYAVPVELLVLVGIVGQHRARKRA